LHAPDECPCKNRNTDRRKESIAERAKGFVSIHVRNK
jgi:hypothetical protein